MASKPNPFLALMKSTAAAKAVVATPEVEEKNTPDSANQDLTNTSDLDKDISSKAEEKNDLQIVTPQAQRLLGGSTAGDSNALSTTDYGPSGLQELARIDTESMEPVIVREHKNLNVEAARLAQKLQLDSMETVRSVLDEMDRRLELVGGASLVGPNLIDIRNYVQSIMITLKTRPEFAETLIDKDIRNVMTFIRATRQEALDLREVKVVKKTVKAEKAANSKAPKLNQMSAAFASVTGMPDFTKFGGGK